MNLFFPLKTLSQTLISTLIGGCYALIQGPPLTFPNSGHASFDIQMRFSDEQLLDGLDADGSVEVRVELLVGTTTPPLAGSSHKGLNFVSYFSLILCFYPPLQLERIYF